MKNVIPPPRGGNKYINSAIRMAMKSPSKYKMAAVIVRGGQIKAIAHNGRNENEHAELRALRKCPDIIGSTIYIVRVRPNGECGLARPCPMCWQALRNANIKQAVWTTDTPTLSCGKIDTPPWAELREPMFLTSMQLPISYRIIYQQIVNEMRA